MHTVSPPHPWLPNQIKNTVFHSQLAESANAKPGTGRAQCIFIGKHPRISKPMWFKRMLFESQLQNITYTTGRIRCMTLGNIGKESPRTNKTKSEKAMKDRTNHTSWIFLSLFWWFYSCPDLWKLVGPVSSWIFSPPTLTSFVILSRLMALSIIHMHMTLQFKSPA